MSKPLWVNHPDFDFTDLALTSDSKVLSHAVNNLYHDVQVLQADLEDAALPDHLIAAMVNELTATAKSHEGCQSLREVFAMVVKSYIRKPNA